MRSLFSDQHVVIHHLEKLKSDCVALRLELSGGSDLQRMHKTSSPSERNLLSVFQLMASRRTLGLRRQCTSEREQGGPDGVPDYCGVCQTLWATSSRICPTAIWRDNQCIPFIGYRLFASSYCPWPGVGRKSEVARFFKLLPVCANRMLES